MLRSVKIATTNFSKSRSRASYQFGAFCLGHRRKRLAVFIDKENVGLHETSVALKKCRELGDVVKAKIYCCLTAFKALKKINPDAEIIPVEPLSNAQDFRRGPTDDAMLSGVDAFVKSGGNSSIVDAVCLVTDDKGICKIAVQCIKSNTNLEVINLIHRANAEVTRGYSLDSHTGMFDSVHLYGNSSNKKGIWANDEVEEALWQYFKAAEYVSDDDERTMRESFNSVSVPFKAMFKFSFYNQLGLDWDRPRKENVSKLLQFCQAHPPKHDPKTHVFVMSLWNQGRRNTERREGRRFQFLLEKRNDKKSLVEEFLVKLGYCQKDVSYQVMQEFISRKHDRLLPKLRANQDGTLDELIYALYDDLTNPELESNRCFWRHKKVRPFPRRP